MDAILSKNYDKSYNTFLQKYIFVIFLINSKNVA